MIKHLWIGFTFIANVALGTAAWADTWRIGVLAHRGYQATFERWEPTAAYLNEKLPYHKFEVVPLDLPDVARATADNEIDFLLTNTGNYVEMEVFHGVSRIATMKNALDGKIFTRFGAVIFTRADRNDINSLSDLKGKRFIGVEENGFGGFRMAWRELKAAGIDPYSDFRELRFSGFPQDEVAFAVRDGVADVGTFRADVLLSMAMSNKIDLSQLKILNQHSYPDYPAVSSTRLYPSWPFAKLSNTPASIAEQVSAALIQMPADSAAAVAAGIGGWTVPLDYQSIHELLIDLKVGPYEHLRHVDWVTVVEQYWTWIAALLALTLATSAASIGLARANHKLHQVETELRRHRDRLAEMIRDATIDMVKARDDALRASEAKSRFLANISHELRTPLNAIIGYSSIVREAATEHGLGEYCDDLTHVIGASNKLLAQIEDLLDVTLLDTGDIELHAESVDVAQLATELTDALQEAAKNNGNSLHPVVEPPATSLNVDPLRLRQILSALLSNANKFTRNGTITLEVANERKLHKDFVCFRVRDTGPGMTEEQQAHLFERFHQIDKTLAKTTDGLGLGMFKARALCERMGGEISVRSEVGYGTEICARLPREQSSAASPAAARSETAEAAS